MDQSTIQAILNQLEKTSLQNMTHQLNTIAALDNAMEEIPALRQQVEILQSAQGTMASLLDWAKHRVATSDSTYSNTPTSCSLPRQLSGSTFSKGGPCLGLWVANIRKMATLPTSFGAESSS